MAGFFVAREFSTASSVATSYRMLLRSLFLFLSSHGELMRVSEVWKLRRCLRVIFTGVMYQGLGDVGRTVHWLTRCMLQ